MTGIGVVYDTSVAVMNLMFVDGIDLKSLEHLKDAKRKRILSRY